MCNINLNEFGQKNPTISHAKFVKADESLSQFYKTVNQIGVKFCKVCMPSTLSFEVCMVAAPENFAIVVYPPKQSQSVFHCSSGKNKMRKSLSQDAIYLLQTLQSSSLLTSTISPR